MAKVVKANRVKGVLVAAAAFVAMEPVAYAAHRWVMHGPGRRWHDSHHRLPTLDGRQHLEANDLYPVCFAAATVAATALGGRHRGVRPVAAGVTAYGLAYAFVHDVAIHRRLGGTGGTGNGDLLAPVPGSRLMERLRTAHARHHATGGEPYGMLLPFTGTARAARPAHVPAPRREVAV